ncbi:MAG: UDP-N-acetylglucosamine--N-acetylmuramyl-(pentapeptide) pyrophosphoryl-undecaprenol N-acetylglucosamine transferase, partial [Mariprofundales bacterium]|nr:UDP-N-acetylglucosamine--N-acetylmuramyl-(pentapeptide) pyrophosphoryl-undecaprenol N-acetylglucosamine transferase [Mariprofundales bacterium]
MTAVVCIAGGGTGGHLMPALALADALRARWPDLSVQFVGAKRGLEANLLPQRGEQVLLLAMHAVSGASWWQRLRVVLLELPKAVYAILHHWHREPPLVVVGVGGYASAMGVVAALCARVPVLLYEQNAIPGMVNRQLARFCRTVLLGMGDAAAHLPHATTLVCGNPVRREVAAVEWQPHTPPGLLVMGGSQGARFLNTTMPQVAAGLQRQGVRFTVRHQCGSGCEAEVRAAYCDAGVDAVVEPFCQSMEQFYGGGDLLIARSGAMTVAECQVIGMPALFIPLPIAADDHQYHNAMALQRVGAAEVLRQESATVDVL